MRDGKILNPEKLFFEEKGSADVQLDCRDSIIAPGFIDVQINGTVVHSWAGGVLGLSIPNPTSGVLPVAGFSCSREV